MATQWNAMSEESEDNLRVLLAFVDEFHREMGEMDGAEGMLDASLCAELENSTATATATEGDVESASQPDRDTTKAGIAAVAQPTKKPAPRTRRREELLELRSKVHELEFQLGAMQRHARTAWKHADDDGVAPAARQSLLSVWEQLAQHQFEQRKAAEEENARLRQSIAQQVKLAKGLESSLKKRTNLQLVGCASACKRICSESKYRPLESEKIEEELKATLPEMYAQLDAAFSDPRFETVETKFKDGQLRVDRNGMASYEFKAARILPFPVESTAKAVWRFLHQAPLGRLSDLRIMDDTIVKSFQVSFDQSQTVYIRGKVVARRFVDGDRTAILSSAILQPVNAAGHPMDGVVLRHQNWRVVQPPRNQRVFESCQTAAQLQFRQRFTADTIHNSKMEKYAPPGESLTDYAVRIFNAKNDVTQRNIENMLLQLSLHDDGEEEASDTTDATESISSTTSVDEHPNR